ncbi:MAG: hypothetical protein ACPGVJ_07205, partial [Mangrovicoccus sp.]
GMQPLSPRGASTHQYSTALAATADGFVTVWVENGDIYQSVWGDPATFSASSALQVTGFDVASDLAESAVNAGLTAIEADGLVGVQASAGANFDGGQLSFWLADQLFDTRFYPLSMHQIGVIDQGSGLGQIGVSGTQVSYEGAVIGSLTLAADGRSLTVDLSGAVTAEAVEALIKALGYSSDWDSLPASLPFGIGLTDSAGHSWQSSGTIGFVNETDSYAIAVPGDTQVNSYAGDDQYGTKMARLADGGWVVTWSDDRTTGSSEDIWAKVFNADGSVRVEEFLVNIGQTGNQQIEAVVTAFGSGFAIAWRDQVQNGSVDGSRSHIMLATFDANGGTDVAPFQVNDYTSDYQWFPAITELTNGDLALVWTSRGQDGSQDGIYGKVLSGADVTQEVIGETRLSTTTSNYQNYADITALDNDRFALVYQSNATAPDSSNYGVFAKVFELVDQGGGVFALTEQMAETLVNSSVTYAEQSQAEIATLWDGLGNVIGFVVVWQDASGADSSGWGIFAQIYDASYQPLGGPIQVNTDSYSTQSQPTVIGLKAGGFVVAWFDDYGGNLDENIVR